MFRKDVDRLDTLFSDKFCPKYKKCDDSKWDRKHDKKDHECKCDKDDHRSKWNKKDGEWKYEEKHCKCKDKHKDHECNKKPQCSKDCVVSILKELTDHHHHNGILSATRPVFHLQMKGTAGFVGLETSANCPTAFTLVSYNHKTGCAKFTYESIMDRSPQVYVVDAKSLCAISPVQA